MTSENKPSFWNGARLALAGGILCMGGGGAVMALSVEHAIHDGNAQMGADPAAAAELSRQQTDDGWETVGGAVLAAAGACGIYYGTRGAWDRLMLVNNPWVWEVSGVAAPEQPPAASPAAIPPAALPPHPQA